MRLCTRNGWKLAFLLLSRGKKMKEKKRRSLSPSEKMVKSPQQMIKSDLLYLEMHTRWNYKSWYLSRHLFLLLHAATVMFYMCQDVGIVVKRLKCLISQVVWTKNHTKLSCRCYWVVYDLFLLILISLSHIFYHSIISLLFFVSRLSAKWRNVVMRNQKTKNVISLQYLDEKCHFPFIIFFNPLYINLLKH